MEGGAALAIAELGVGAFFVVGLARALAGDWAPWVVLAAGLLSVLARAADVESWALFIPGGLIGRAEHAFGVAWRPSPRRPCSSSAWCSPRWPASSSPITSRTSWWRRGWLAGHRAPDVRGGRQRIGDRAARRPLAPGAHGAGHPHPSRGARRVGRSRRPRGDRGVGRPHHSPPRRPARSARASRHAGARRIGFTGPGSVDHHARRFRAGPSPGRAAERRSREAPTSTSRRVFRRCGGLAPSCRSSCSPSPYRSRSRTPCWCRSSPNLCGSIRRWPGLGQHLAGPPWARGIAGILVAVTAVLLLVPAAYAALSDAEQLLRRLASTHRLAERLGRQHPRFGTYAYAADLAAACTVFVILAGGGRVPWIAHAYAVGVALTLLIRLLTLVRLRTRMPGPRAYRVPLNLRVGGMRVAVGLVLAIAVSSAALLGLIAIGDVPAIATGILVGGLVILLKLSPHAEPEVSAEESGHVRAAALRRTCRSDRSRPGPATCWSRSAIRTRCRTWRAALQAAGDRDVVVMTARLLGVDVEDDSVAPARADAAERRLLSRRRRAGRAVSTVPCSCSSCRRRTCSTRSSPRSRGSAVSEVYVGESVAAVGRRPGAAARRGLGARRQARGASTSGSSSTTTAAAPTRITSARIRPRSRPAISI